MLQLVSEQKLENIF